MDRPFKARQTMKPDIPDPDKVQLWTKEILYFMLEQPEGTEFLGSEIANTFEISITEATKRVNKLRKWGMVKIKRNRKPRTCIVTRWGQEWAQNKMIRTGEADEGSD